VPKIPWRACGNFVPKNQLRLFCHTQSFPPKESAQDSMESLWKFCSKKSTAAFSPHAKFSAKRECPRFHEEPVEILIQKVKCDFFATRKVFRQKRVPKIPWRACENFVPKNQLRLFRHTQSFQPEESAQDSMESLRKFCSKKSTAALSSHAKFSTSRECPRFHGEHVEIQGWLCVYFIEKKHVEQEKKSF
jgi:hypothetical protein